MELDRVPGTSNVKHGVRSRAEDEATTVRPYIQVVAFSRQGRSAKGPTVLRVGAGVEAIETMRSQEGGSG